MKQILIKKTKYPLKYNYYIDEKGRIYSEKTHKFLSVQLDKDGYEKVRLISNDNKRHRYSVHRLMMENFHPKENMENLQVNHIDGNKVNNNLENLEWVTPGENIEHAYQIGLKNQRGEHNNASKLTESNVQEIIEKLKNKQSMYSIAKEYGVCLCTIKLIKDKKTWKYLTENIDFN